MMKNVIKSTAKIVVGTCDGTVGTEQANNVAKVTNAHCRVREATLAEDKRDRAVAEQSATKRLLNM